MPERGFIPEEAIGFQAPKSPETERIEDKCGIFSTVSREFTDNLQTTLKAAGGVQHRGQQGAGLAQMTQSGLRVYRADGLIREALTESVIREQGLAQPTLWELFHSRYGTAGGYGAINLQPCVEVTPQGEEFALIHNGEVIITADMMKHAPPGMELTVSDTYLLTKYIAHAPGETVQEKFLNALPNVRGAYSLMVGSRDHVLLARDELGIKPLVVGQQGEKYVAASETHAFDKINAKAQRELKRGEVVRMDKNGFHTLREGLPGSGFECSFENAYTRRPDSLYIPYRQPDDNEYPEKWRSVLRFRERVGEHLAQEAPFPRASYVVGVPDSGVAVAQGYANALRLPYRQVIIRDHFDPNGDKRLFQTDNEMDKIQSKVLGKLSLVPDPEIWEGKNIVIGDDSIVRGSVSRRITAALKNLGVREVRWMSGYPVIQYGCHLGVSMRSGDELIGAKYSGDLEKIAADLGATSTNFISPAGFLRARYPNRELVIPSDLREIFLQNGECGGCVTGMYPVSKEGVLYQQREVAAA